MTKPEQAKINRDCDEAKQGGEVTPGKNGVAYQWGIQNADGAWFVLFREKHHSDADIQRAKRHLHNSRDVVDIQIKEVK